jgi:hypothetical protein
MMVRSGFKVIWIDGFFPRTFVERSYKKFASIIKNYIGIEIPQHHYKITNNRYIALLKSIFGYHSIHIAVKM